MTGFKQKERRGRQMKYAYIWLCAWLAGQMSLADGLKLPSILSDHMVLQQNASVPIWGKADPNAEVTVSFKGQSKTVHVDSSGRWRVNLAPMQADAKPAVLTVSSGRQTNTVNDVLIGEVWLCSGQSNMEWPLQQANNGAVETANANWPQIRHIKAPRNPQVQPQEDVDAVWTVCSPQTAGGYTAVGYFFGRRLYQELNVPIGLINCSWGGTRIEPWTPVEGFAAIPDVKELYQAILARLPGSNAYQQQGGQYLTAMQQWMAAAEKNFAASQAIPEPVAFPATLKPYTDRQDPTLLYNGMMSPFVPFAIHGAIWYQGEANCTDGLAYVPKSRALLAGWRLKWEKPELPFYFVQIAPFNGYGSDPTVLAKFWEAQGEVEKTIPHTGMVVINDIGNIGNIHPTNKQDVGLRLANMALNREYGRKDLIDQGPTFREMKVSGNRIQLIFDHVADGLKSRDGKPVSWFELSDASGSWKPAVVQISAPDTLELTVSGMEAPVAVRFAWNKTAEPNLINSAGLPAGAFRTGAK